MKEDEIRCPWCNSWEFNSWEELEDTPHGILRTKPYIAFCGGCEKFFKIEMKIKITKMKLVEVIDENN